MRPGSCAWGGVIHPSRLCLKALKRGRGTHPKGLLAPGWRVLPPRLLLELLGRQVLLVRCLLVVEDEVQRVGVELGEDLRVVKGGVGGLGVGGGGGDERVNGARYGMGLRILQIICKTPENIRMAKNGSC